MTLPHQYSKTMNYHHWLYHQWFTTNVMPLFTATQPGQDHKSSPDTPDTSCMSLQVALWLCLCVYLCIYHLCMKVCVDACLVSMFVYLSGYLCMYLLIRIHVLLYLCTDELLYCSTICKMYTILLLAHAGSRCSIRYYAIPSVFPSTSLVFASSFVHSFVHS